MYIPEAFGATELGWEILGPLLLMALLFALAVPVWASLGLTAVIILWLTGALPLGLIGESVFHGLDAFALIAIPLFVLTGDVLVRTGLSVKLLNIAEATMGSVRSGLGTSTVLGCGFFACISGSDAAGAAAVGRITISRLIDSGYSPAYACALVASGACTGILIPPSIAYIIIGMVLGISTSTLFLAAAVPGVLIMASIMITNAIMNRINGYEHARRRFVFREWLAAVWDGRYALLIPIIIFGGIYSGIFTPTEAAAVAVVTTIAVGLFQGTFRLRDFPGTLEGSAKVCGVIVPIIAVALPLAQVLAINDVPQSLIASVNALTENPTLIILMMLGVFILAGCVMETTPNIVILAPIMLPLAQSIGMNDIHFCIFMITSLGIGFITPPLGLNLFVISGITGQPVLSIAAKAVPFVLAMLAVVLLLAFVPELSLFLLR
ncbi:tripartite ATP-independent transporter DctM subunit [Natronocella acetinitrilica]|uniref:TRAP transporter large permease protein n=1 Tax=Natronocella acetinitrilica TaxID=414046 RepID=A0AAE3KF11_9GAMM|nr:TRAP transporter large permease [Natronocella acetinitrilica]MCP1673642.1 tripartite ATP-independent transporter DctM subunit [Natronocella acetinitrilica]